MHPTGTPDNRPVLDELLRGGKLSMRRSALFDEPPPGAAEPVDFARVEGMVLGLAIGDALGNTTEGMPPADRRAFCGEVRDYLPNPRRRRRGDGEPCRVGLPSDDTQLAGRTLAQGLADGGLVCENLAHRLAAGPIWGLGNTVRQFVENHRAGLPWFECGPRSAANGALMRIAPILVPHVGSADSRLWADAALAAAITHNDPASTAACVAFVAILWDLLHARAAPEERWPLRRYVEVAAPIEGETRYGSRRPPAGAARARFPSADGQYVGPVWRFVETRVAAMLDAPAPPPAADACRTWGSGAYLLETLPSVLYILCRHLRDPEEAIVRAVNDTADNDTIGAIVGAAVGALHGRDALPARWREGLVGGIEIRQPGGDAAADGQLFDLLDRARREWGGAAP